MSEPVYVVIPVRDRHSMIDTLARQLAAQQPAAVFVLDNESYPPQPEWGPPVHTIPMPNTSLHGLWNAGLDMAEGHARAGGHKAWNVAVLNSDVEVAPNFLAALSLGLRIHDDVWIAYPNIHGLADTECCVLDDPTSYTGQTMAGWAWMIRGECGLRVDEQFVWWYGDSDLEAQVRAAGKHAICVGPAHATHLDANGHVLRDSWRLNAARVDERRYAEKWGLDPSTLFLARNPGWGAA